MKKLQYYLMAIVPLSILIILGGCSKLKWSAAALFLDIPSPMHSVSIDENVMIPLRDGTKLAADIYRPGEEGRYPVILVRTPYGKGKKEHKYDLQGGIFASHGFVTIIQDVRGRYDSEGEWYPFINEAFDGVDTLKWARDQAWSSGKVGMFGLSYFGSTQWLASPYDNTGLATLVPVVTSQSTYGLWMTNGVLKFNQTLIWHHLHKGKEEISYNEAELEKALMHLPLIEADDVLGGDIPAYNDWIRHPVPGDFWEPMNVDDKIDQVKVPALLMAGWNDPFLVNMLEDYDRILTGGGGPLARKSQIVIGPWIHGTDTKFDDLDYGKASRFMGQIGTMLRWYDHWLKGIENGVAEELPVKLFVMGKNEWRSEKEWPLKRTTYMNYYLHGKGRANSDQGDGRLTLELPGQEQNDVFIYDPADPVPTMGGALVYDNVGIGPVDQRPIETRPDVLIYSTPPLEKDMEITGPITLVLFASSSARDTDFVARLVDVHPEGVSIPLTTGITRARYRWSLKNPSFLKPDEVYEFKITVGATSNVFQKGHKIRLHLTSSDFPRYDRNLNTGAEIGTTTEMVKATQRVFHNKEWPSHLILPVIPVGK
jgi:putative CocE/NonD family hydrolase